ncbi:hypothetical protein [Taibaiella koreensis]|uniref:hypothetical protein n=1 Tax=Taibaiella koreensis TaxID=1268548 RepID=UPI000E5A0C24|nr:hypothetical protein [Taibaiella koreensis]
MKYIFTIFFLCTLTQAGYAATTEVPQLAGHTWKLQEQIYANQEGSATDTHKVVGQAGDYIRFEKNGKAIVHYQGNTDTLDYSLKDNMLYIGAETPYLVAVTGPKAISLLQQSKEANGDYSSILLELKW